MTAPTAADRRRDALSVALLVVGIAIFCFGWWKLRAMELGLWIPAVDAGSYPRVAHWSLLRYVSFAGLAIALAGIAVGVLAHLRHTRPPRLADEQENRP